MKRAELLFFLLILSLCLAGCGERVRGIHEDTAQLHLIYPQVAGMKEKAVQDRINALLYSTAFTLKDEQRSEVEMYKDSYNYYVQYEVTRFDKKVLSIKFMECLSMPWYAHPINKLCAVTLNPKDGSVYGLKDIFKPGSNYRAVLNRTLKGKIAAYAAGTGAPLLKEFKAIGKDQEFYLTKDSVAVFWQEAEYMPRYLGPLNVMVEYSRLTGILLL